LKSQEGSTHNTYANNAYTASCRNRAETPVGAAISREMPDSASLTRRLDVLFLFSWPSKP
jgi:hypothetical protein